MRDEVPDDAHGSRSVTYPTVSRRVAVAFVVGAAAIGLAACSGGSSKTTSPTTKPSAPHTTTIAALVRTPTDAAEQLYFAWQRADKAGAATLATPGAVTSLFAITSTKAAGLAFVGCTKPANGTSTCSWKRTDAKLTMHVSAPPAGRPQVQAVALT
jgi:hypothetical protein